MIDRQSPPPPFPPYMLLGDLFAPVQPPVQLNALFGFGMTTTPAPPTLGEVLASVSTSYRRRQDWNQRFAHWQRPASVSEEGTLERAQANVGAAARESAWLSTEGVTIEGQGSYHNATNVRTDADIDLRAMHPLLMLEYAPNVVVEAAHSCLGIYTPQFTVSELFSHFRSELTRVLSLKFGRPNVDDSGSKAIKIKGITGSRARVDVVPAVIYRFISWDQSLVRYDTIDGMAILSTDGKLTINFPEQHRQNGVSKRRRTKQRFKKAVRIFKQLRTEMEEIGLLKASVPSFLIECLVYAVEDAYFLVEEDDTYDRVRRIAWRMRELLRDDRTALPMTEVNEMQELFRPGQGWIREDAMIFADASVAHLGSV